MRAHNEVIIAGAGLTGAMLAVFLARRGHQVAIIEKRPDIARARPDSRRTIAMSISHRGWKALASAGLAEGLREACTPSYGRITHHPSGVRYRQPYGRGAEAIDTIDRKLLNCALIEAAVAHPRCTIHYDTRVEAIDFDGKRLRLATAAGAREVGYDYLFATDGVFSRCRREHERHCGLDPQIRELDIGYKEFTIPYDVVEDLALDRRHVHVWPGGTATFVALPSRTKRAFLGNLFCTNAWVEFFERRPSKAEIIELMTPSFPLLEGLLGRLDEVHFTEPSNKIYITNSERWAYGDSFLLLGDAIHGMAPFYAMGMNTCFEDCDEFDELLSACADDLAKAVRGFQGRRKHDVDAMQRISLENFENLSRSSEAWFDQQWRLDRRLSEQCPEHWITECALISFHDIPFSEVGPRVEQQQRFVAAHGLSEERVAAMSAAELDDLREKIRGLGHP